MGSACQDSGVYVVRQRHDPPQQAEVQVLSWWVKGTPEPLTKIGQRACSWL